MNGLSRGWKGSVGTDCWPRPQPSIHCIQSRARQPVRASPTSTTVQGCLSILLAPFCCPPIELRLPGWNSLWCEPHHARTGKGLESRRSGRRGRRAVPRAWRRLRCVCVGSTTPVPACCGSGPSHRSSRPAPSLGLPAFTPPLSRPDLLPPSVRALNNFLLFGKRNNAPDFTRGKQPAEQNKKQM